MNKINKLYVYVSINPSYKIYENYNFDLENGKKPLPFFIYLFIE